MVAVLLVILFRRCLNEDDVSFHADVVGKHSVMLIGSPKDISSVFSVPVRRENRIYPCLYDEELQKIIAVIDTGTEKGKRDMAMILLGVSVGMRAIDIINLKLTDIDWAHGEIHLVQKKIGQSVFLPANAGCRESNRRLHFECKTFRENRLHLSYAQLSGTQIHG